MLGIMSPIVDVECDHRLVRRDIAGEPLSVGDYSEHEENTHNETSCFQTGLCAERPPNMPGDAVPDVPPLSVDPPKDFVTVTDALPDGADDEGVIAARARAAASKALPMLMAPSALKAVDEPFLDMLVATPFTSFSDSEVGSLLTNSFCSN